MFKERSRTLHRCTTALASLLCALPLIASAELTAPPGLKIDGRYDAFVAVSGGGSVADTDGDGAAELFLEGFSSDAWRRVRYDTASQGYVIDRSPPVPFPLAAAARGTPSLVATVGNPARHKIYSLIAPSENGSATSVAIYDGQSGELDLISQVSSGSVVNGPVAAIDLNADGDKEIVLAGSGYVDIYDPTLTRHLGHSFVGVPFVIGNFDPDAAVEIVTQDGVVMEFAPFELREERRLAQGFTAFQRMEAGDGDGDGIDEIFTDDNAQRVWAIDVQTGSTKWEADLPSVARWVIASTVADVNGDGREDFVVVEVGHPADPAHVVAYNGTTGVPLVTITLEPTAAQASGISAADFDGDGSMEIAVDVSPNLRIYSASTGQLEWQSLSETSPFRALAMGDVDSDGDQEVVFSSGGMPGVGDLHLHAYDAKTFAPLWTTPLPLLPQAGTGQIMTLTIADIDDDGDREILVGSARNAQAHIWVVDGQTHQLTHEFSLPFTFNTISALAVADIDDDGDVEILVGTHPDSTGSTTNMLLLDPVTGDFETVYISQGFREVKAFATWESAAGVDFAFVDNRRQTLGSTLVYNAAPTLDPHFLPTDLALSVALLDSHGDAAPEVVAGRRDGAIEVFDSRALTSLSVTQVCNTPVHAIVPNRLPGARRGEALFSCEERIGAIDVSTGEHRGLTSLVGYTVGLANSLVVTGTSANDVSVTATVAGGVRHLVSSQSAPVAIIPPLGLAARTHWGRPVTSLVNTTSFGSMPVTLEFLQAPEFGTVTPFPSIGPAYEYLSGARSGIDHFVVRAITAAGASPPVAIMVIVDNNIPIVHQGSLVFTAQPGVERAFFVSAHDPDDDPITYELLSTPGKGTIQFDTVTGTFRYTARADATGQDSFIVRVFDRVHHSEPATFTVTIEQPTSPPPPTPPPTPPPSTGGSGGGGGGGSLGWLSVLLLLSASVGRYANARRMKARVLALICLFAATLVHAASIEKARALKTNGLLTEAKGELVEVSFDDAAPSADKAEALLLLGDIGLDEGKPDVAAENWSKVARDYAQEAAARIATEKLSSLSKGAARTPAVTESPKPQTYPAGTVLVVGPQDFAWSIPQIAAALGSHATPFNGSVVEAMAHAKSNSAIVGVAEIALSVETAFESGRVVCSLPNGSKVWEEKVMFNLGGGAERIARRFVDGLSKKVANRPCPGSSK